MKKGKFQNGTHFRGGKVIAALLAVVLLVGATIGGTIAWLTASTEKVENTFTVGNIDITLTETTEDYKMIPGYTIDKDPVVTVLKNSEDCWVFVKVEESNDLKDYIQYEVDSSNWTKLEGEEGVWYTKYESRDDTDIGIKVLQNNQVQVLDTVTKEMMDALDGVDADGKTDTADAKAEIAARPKLTFTAYAVQYYSSNNTPFDVAEAWKQVKG